MVAAGPSFTNYAIDALTCITALHLIDVCTTINRFSMKLEGLHFPPPLLGRDAQFITYESSSWRLFIANNCTELESLSKLSRSRLCTRYLWLFSNQSLAYMSPLVSREWEALLGSRRIFDIFSAHIGPDNDGGWASQRVLAEEITFKFESWGTDSIWEDQGGLIRSIIITILFNEENTLLS